MFISGIGTALPPNRFTQVQCWETLHGWPGFAQLAPRSRAILRKVLLADNGIVTRHFAIDGLDGACSMDPDVLHRRFVQHGPALGSQAATQAMRQAGVRADEIDALIISTCTGYLCPGLSSYIAELLGLRSEVLPLDLVGQGCGAALPNLRSAEALLAAGRAQCVLSICVEICSAAFYLDDDPGVLISACLFADGAGAAVLTASPRTSARRVHWKDSGSILDPSLRDSLRFEQKGGLLRNILTPPVPVLASEKAANIFRVVAGRSDVKHKEIAGWIFHAGGRDVLTALEQRFALQSDDLQWSASVLRDIGNISSPFVFFVLERALRAPARGGWWWLSSFGAGFSCHGALLQVD